MSFVETDDQPDTEPDDQPEPRRGGAAILCFVLGLLVLALCALYLINAWRSAPSWASAPGVVTRNTVQVYNGTHGRLHARYTSYIPAIEYHYEVDGRDYRGQGIGDGVDHTYNNPEEALAEMAPYTHGPLTVYYDRADPSHSALDTGLVWRFILIPLGIGLAFMGFGFALRWADRLED
jgi:hypothetical protein